MVTRYTAEGLFLHLHAEEGNLVLEGGGRSNNIMHKARVKIFSNTPPESIEVRSSCMLMKVELLSGVQERISVIKSKISKSHYGGQILGSWSFTKSRKIV